MNNDKGELPSDVVLYVDNSLHWAVTRASTAFHANVDVNMRLGFAFCDGFGFATHDARPALNTGISDNVRHALLPFY